MILKTRRLHLRMLSQEDFPALCRTLKDPEAMYAYEGAFDDAGVQAWLDKMLWRYREENMGLWAVILEETGEFIGQCGLTIQDCFGEKVIEVGYLFERAHWHHGYALEAAMACRDYAFREYNAGEVFSIIRDTNAPSVRVALRNGMQPRGSFVKHYRGIDMPHIVYSIRRDEWSKFITP